MSGAAGLVAMNADNFEILVLCRDGYGLAEYIRRRAQFSLDVLFRALFSEIEDVRLAAKQGIADCLQDARQAQALCGMKEPSNTKIEYLAAEVFRFLAKTELADEACVSYCAAVGRGLREDIGRTLAEFVGCGERSLAAKTLLDLVLADDNDSDGRTSAVEALVEYADFITPQEAESIMQLYLMKKPHDFSGCFTRFLDTPLRETALVMVESWLRVLARDPIVIWNDVLDSFPSLLRTRLNRQAMEVARDAVALNRISERRASYCRCIEACIGTDFEEEAVSQHLCRLLSHEVSPATRDRETKYRIMEFETALKFKGRGHDELLYNHLHAAHKMWLDDNANSIETWYALGVAGIFAKGDAAKLETLISIAEKEFGGKRTNEIGKANILHNMSIFTGTAVAKRALALLDKGLEKKRDMVYKKAAIQSLGAFAGTAEADDALVRLEGVIGHVGAEADALAFGSLRRFAGTHPERVKVLAISALPDLSRIAVSTEAVRCLGGLPKSFIDAGVLETLRLTAKSSVEGVGSAGMRVAAVETLVALLKNGCPEAETIVDLLKELLHNEEWVVKAAAKKGIESAAAEIVGLTAVLGPHPGIVVPDWIKEL